MSFFSHFYPNYKASDGSHLLTNFKNRPRESLIRAYVRFKDLLHKSPHHDLPTWYVLHIFYGGLQEANRTALDLAA
jgi:hypothetical protein